MLFHFGPCFALFLLCFALFCNFFSALKATSRGLASAPKARNATFCPRRRRGTRLSVPRRRRGTQLFRFRPCFALFCTVLHCFALFCRAEGDKPRFGVRAEGAERDFLSPPKARNATFRSAPKARNATFDFKKPWQFPPPLPAGFFDFGFLLSSFALFCTVLH